VLRISISEFEKSIVAAVQWFEASGNCFCFSSWWSCWQSLFTLSYIIPKSLGSLYIISQNLENILRQQTRGLNLQCEIKYNVCSCTKSRAKTNYMIKHNFLNPYWTYWISIWQRLECGWSLVQSTIKDDNKLFYLFLCYIHSINERVRTNTGLGVREMCSSGATCLSTYRCLREQEL